MPPCLELLSLKEKPFLWTQQPLPLTPTNGTCSKPQKGIHEPALDEIIEINDLSSAPQRQLPDPNPGKGSRGTFGLPPCAQKMLRDGISEFQRVGCFRLAVHLKRLGLPYDVAIAALKTWATKNKPANGKEHHLRKGNLGANILCL